MRFLPTFPAHARPAATLSGTAWQSGLAFIVWLRVQLDAVGHAAQPVLLGNGAFAAVGMWWELTSWMGLIVRSARHCRLPLLRATSRDRPRL
ncbi:MAG: hypothetical protein WHS83_09425 [Chloroflexus sp.]|uniref:hypothetical protein n=1 Tax=Chloroflexus sp. TaxID=1904827 RepID=UPI0030A013E4